MHVFSVAMLLLITGCASSHGGLYGDNAEYAADPDGVAKPGGLIESNLPFAERCRSGQLMVCKSDSSGNDCSCVDSQYMERNINTMMRGRMN